MRNDLAKELVMEQFATTPMTIQDFGKDGSTMPVDVALNGADEFEWLMSLALDDALDEEEAARFETLLAQEPARLEQWAAWQAMDSAFQHVPAVLPPADFCAKFEQRLAISERQRRLRTGILFGLAAVVLWGSALAGTVMLGALLWTSQDAWLGSLVHNFAYWWAAIQQFGETLVNTGETLWSAPQTRVAFICYLGIAAGILAAWFVFLRRSLREVPLVEA